MSGGAHNLALDVSGSCYVWGNNLYHQCGIENQDVLYYPQKLSVSKKVVDIAAALDTSYLLYEDGTVAAFGSNRKQEIGSNYRENVPLPVEVQYTEKNFLYLPFQIKGYVPGYGTLERELRKGWQREMEL